MQRFFYIFFFIKLHTFTLRSCISYFLYTADSITCRFTHRHFMRAIVTHGARPTDEQIVQKTKR